MTERFDNKAIYLDTAPLIYYIEETSAGLPFLQDLFKKNEKGDFTFFTSTLTLCEVLTLPFKLGNTKLIEQYEYFITQSPFLKLINVNADIAKLAARLRSEYNLKLPDATHLATAIEVKVDFFLTNDLALKKVKGLTIITPTDG
jgi:predicted nucleic acid-binding protein